MKSRFIAIDVRLPPDETLAFRTTTHHSGLTESRMERVWTHSVGGQTFRKCYARTQRMLHSEESRNDASAQRKVCGTNLW